MNLQFTADISLQMDDHDWDGIFGGIHINICIPKNI